MEFAVTELRGGENGKCLRTVVWVDNFEEQVSFTQDGDTDDKDDDYDDVAAHWFPLRVRAEANCMRHHSSECHILPHNCTIQ